MSPTPPEVWDAEEAARYLRINVQTIRRLARESDLPAFKVGGTWRFRKSSLDRWADSRQEERRGMGILVIERGHEVAGRLRDVLEGCSVRIARAPDGGAALSFMQNYGADLVVLDLAEGAAEGLAALGRVRERFPGVPVVVTLAAGDAETASRVLAHSPVTLLARPFSDEQALAAVRNSNRSREAGVRR